MIMMIIPNIMSTGNIDKCFMEFFCFNNNPDIKQCNLEMVINNKDLPQFSHYEKQVYLVPTIIDFKNPEREIIREIQK